MKVFIFTTCMIFCLTNTFGQIKYGKHITNNNFEILFNKSISTCDVQPNAFNKPLFLPTIGLNSGLYFYFTKHISPRFSASLGWGIGKQKINYRFKPYNLFYKEKLIEEKWNSRTFYQKVELVASYRFSALKNIDSKLNFGFGVNFYPRHLGFYNYDIVEKSYIDNSFYYPDTFNYYYGGRYYIENYFNNQVYLTIGYETLKKLKNRNYISLGLNFNKSFQELYFGTYEFFSKEYDYFGFFDNNGNLAGINLKYIYTGEKRKAKKG